MKKYSLFSCLLALTTLAQAAAVIEVSPSSTSPIILAPSGATFVAYNAKNTTTQVLTRLTIEPSYDNNNNALKFTLAGDDCSTIAAGKSCTFMIAIQGKGQLTQATLTPRVCAFQGGVCSIPVLNQRLKVSTNKAIPSSQFPLPYAGTFYPIYNFSAGQWLPPTNATPFTRTSAIFVAFAHAYPEKNGAILTFEKKQPDEPARLALLVQTARQSNRSVKILISLGWGQKDWAAINTDYVNHANIFVPSVIQFIRSNKLDGFDIDDESIGTSSGSIPQANFDGVIANLRNALNKAAMEDGKPYYLTITPAGNNTPSGIDDTQVNSINAQSFDLINIQSYFDDGSWGPSFFDSLVALGYPKKQIANGIDVEESKCQPDFPQPYVGLAGMFNWNMTKDSTCSNSSSSSYAYTIEIANLVNYFGTLT